MKIALLAYSSDTGLGYQTREFYKRFSCAKVLIADLSKYNGMPLDHSWCTTEHRICDGFPSNEDCEWLVTDVDLVFVCETPLNYSLFTMASIRGVKTVQQFNYEFFDYFENPYLPKPSIFASPSMWNIDRAKNLNIGEVVYWPVPVETEKYKFKQRTNNGVYVHIAGRPASNDRNGTLSFLKATQYVGNNAKFKMFIQTPIDDVGKRNFESLEREIKQAQSNLGKNFELIENISDNSLMYDDGDVMVMPRRYGGLCLPLWEALSSGMPVIMTNIDPNYYSLPKEWLCEANIISSFTTKVSIPIYEADISDLVLKMQSVMKNVEQNSLVAKKLADKMSWENQKPEYIKRFNSL